MKVVYKTDARLIWKVRPLEEEPSVSGEAAAEGPLNRPLST